MSADSQDHAIPTPGAPIAEGLAPEVVTGPDEPLKGASFQNRIAMVALITAVAVLTASTTMFIVQEWRTDRERLIQHQTELAKVTANRLSTAIGDRDWSDAGKSLEGLSGSPKVRSAYLLDARGARVADYRRAGTPPNDEADTVQVEAPVTMNGERAGELVVISDGDRLGSILPRFVALAGSLFFVAAGLALFLGRWLAAKVTRPVNRMSVAMREVARSRDFARRVERGEDDEFGRMIDSFNDLLAQLHRNDLDLRAAMSELVEARDAAEAANVLKSHFLANMSHEIRTPLNGVLAMAQIMDMDELKPNQRERLTVISRSGEALLGILNDILDLSKIEAGRMELEAVEFSAGDLAAEVASVFEPQAAQKGLKFRVEVTPEAAGSRLGDRVRVLQILSNLSANAVKFTHEGEIGVTVAGDGPDGADGLLLKVTDTGIGLAADKLPMLFQKFSQLDSSTTRKFGGTGLGLAICRELAHLMGGRIWAESEEGAGSTFWVSLPLERHAEGEAAAKAESSAKAQPRAAVEEDRPLRVLAAEDNATNQLVLKSVMATFDVDLRLVENGQLAVDAWAAEDFDVVLMDIQMPVMDGVAATKAIRAAEAESGGPRTPIVALSANAMTHQVKEYLAAGMDRHVAKPIEIAKLHAALVAVLEPGEAEAAPTAETAVA